VQEEKQLKVKSLALAATIYKKQIFRLMENTIFLEYQVFCLENLVNLKEVI
jgi:hypothetical protein